MNPGWKITPGRRRARPRPPPSGVRCARGACTTGRTPCSRPASWSRSCRCTSRRHRVAHHAGAPRHRDVGLRERGGRCSPCSPARRWARSPTRRAGASRCCSGACSRVSRARGARGGAGAGRGRRWRCCSASRSSRSPTGNVLYDSLLPAVARARGDGRGLGARLRARLPRRRAAAGGAPGVDPDAAPLRPARREAATRVVVRERGRRGGWPSRSRSLRDVPEPEAGRHGVPARAAAGRDAPPARPHALAPARAPATCCASCVAFWLYSDGIGTIIKMATIYGAEVGIGEKRPDRRAAHGAARGGAGLARVRAAREAARAAARRAAGHRGLRAASACSPSSWQRPWHFWVLAAHGRAVPGRHAGALALDVRLAGAARAGRASSSASTR